MNAEQLSLIAGTVLSIALQIIPGLKDWFGGLSADIKRLFIVGVLAVTALGVFGLSCLGILDSVVCDASGAWAMFEFWALAAVANQVAYQFIRKHD